MNSRTKKLIIKLLIIFSSILAAVGLTYTQVKLPTASTTDTSSFQKTFDYAQKNLPLSGELTLKQDGFVYLKVDDDYIHKLYPMLDLKKDGFKIPPVFRTKDSPGAHITVFYADEHVVPTEIGQEYHFKLSKIKLVKASRDIEYVVLEVKSPELEKLRKKYGVITTPSGHDFHISLARKKYDIQHPQIVPHLRWQDQFPN